MRTKSRPLPRLTYVPIALSEARKNWFLYAKKIPYLDPIVEKQRPGVKEADSFYYPKASFVSDFFKSLMRRTKASGLRIYFGSWGEKANEYARNHAIPLDRHDRCRIVFFYVPTMGTENNIKNIETEYWYLGVKTGSQPKRLDKVLAQALRTDYINEKASALMVSLLPENKALGETTSVFFEKKLIDEITAEIDYQMTLFNNVTGVKVEIVSYTNQSSPSIRPPLLKRLSVQFSFTGKNGEELVMTQEDPDYQELERDYQSYLKSENSNMEKVFSYNTGNPTPPYPPNDDIT